MPLSSNTKPGDLGHAQVLRDIEYLYMMIGGGGTEGVGDGQLQDGTNLDPDLGTALSDRAEDGAVGININQRIDRLIWWVDWMRRNMPDASPQITTLQIGRGNTIYTGAITLYGIKSINTAYTTDFPTQNPVAGTTYDDGVGYGYIVDATGTVSATPSWVINSSISVDGVLTGNTCLYHLPEGSRCFAIQILMRAYTGGGTTPAYLVWRT